LVQRPKLRQIQHCWRQPRTLPIVLGSEKIATPRPILEEPQR
jgi:hypothetical protein